MKTETFLFDIECAITGALSNLWEEYGGYVVFVSVIAIMICLPFSDNIYRSIMPCDMEYNSASYTSLIDEQIEMIKIQDAIKNGGNDDISGEDLSFRKAKSIQKEDRDAVLGLLQIAPPDITSWMRPLNSNARRK